ncbi:MAG: DNA mismatch repair endonuclease MutL [Chitinophagales bacterium]
MTDIIKLLPDAIANQIAAGEVIQRPASAIKELLENAIDAGSTHIQLIVKDAGKSLIQVVDNGCGMSETDARLCFERHATSKIKEANDLFAIRTLGFRGEAMASIAAITHVELKTRTPDTELGTRIVIEGSEVKLQEPCQCPIGTSIAIKNLFFNVPARRNFLKSNAVEMRHIIDEFQRVAFANPQIFFSLHNNKVPVFHLPAANLRKRIVGILGHNTNQRLIPVEESVSFLRIYGFVGKPKYARKTRGEQYFFVNERFIKSSYLNHAVLSAYEDLLPSKNYPLYIIFFDIDPARIDVNVHPTKQEIKFDDEKTVYNLLTTVVKKALATHNIVPTIDFDRDIQLTSANQFSTKNERKAHEKYTPSPFDDNSIDFGKKEKNFESNQSSFGREKGKREEKSSYTSKSNFRQADYQKPKVPKNWEELYKTGNLNPKTPKDFSEKETEVEQATTITIKSSFSSANPTKTLQSNNESANVTRNPTQVHYRYILSQLKSGFILIDQQLAHERILYEKYERMLKENKATAQQLLFPQTMELSAADSFLLKDILPIINDLGYDIKEFGSNRFIIHGVPADTPTKGEEQTHIETLLEQYKENLNELKLDKRTNLARTMARNQSIKVGQRLSIEEMENLVDQLFACQTPFVAPNGRPTFVKYNLSDIEKQFERKTT